MVHWRQLRAAESECELGAIKSIFIADRSKENATAAIHMNLLEIESLHIIGRNYHYFALHAQCIFFFLFCLKCNEPMLNGWRFDFMKSI